MEEFEGWDVEVTAVPYPNASLPASLLPAKQIKKEMQYTAVSTSVEISPAVACESPAAKPKQAFKQNQLPKSRIGHAKAKLTRKPQSPSRVLEQKHQKERDVNVGQQNKEADRETLQKLLPKIPCLSSFKNQQSTSAWSMTEYVKDYEYFVKEGLEREVEIVRSYTAPGEHYKHVESDAFNSTGMESSSCVATAAGVLTGESDSDSSSCSSRSSVYSQEDQSSVRVSSDAHQRDDVTLSTNQTVQRHTQQFSCVPKPEQLQESSSLQKELKQNVKRSKLNSHTHSVPITKPSKGRTTGGTAEDDPQAKCLPPHCENQSSEEYWRTYYQAWRNYYTEASRSYYRMYQRPVNMLTAYHANAVYFEELLRGNW